ncbi:hypothetical protein PoB_002795700 [Plakobranchus ocellatus]|uniref:Uncharacterized protein n=1 Tax=Plakobranchus ocellatus TaxID=259542 RepID=A0AAV4A3L5_9GAST|nr:hypothetical protein PoB_002795700 [Plakobranchus ocellatus]
MRAQFIGAVRSAIDPVLIKPDEVLGVSISLRPPTEKALGGQESLRTHLLNLVSINFDGITTMEISHTSLSKWLKSKHLKDALMQCCFIAASCYVLLTVEVKVITN